MYKLLNMLWFILRLVLLSALALATQVFMSLEAADNLRVIQQLIKRFSNWGLDILQVPLQYGVTYQLVAGDNILLHLLLILIFYVVFWLLLLPFRRER